MTRHVSGAAALVAIAVCVASPVLFFAGSIDESSYRFLFAAGSLAWFVAAVTWVGTRKKR
jgi:hypothetical protein